MSQNTTIQCPHELRPGIKVCLHCLHDARRATAKRRLQLAMRISITLVVILVAAGVGGAGVQLLRNRQPEQPQAASPSAGAPVPATAPVVSNVPSDSTPKQRAPAAEVASISVPSAMSPVVPEGVTELASGVRTERSGDTVVVNFDTPLLRTRRPAKFEEILRSTLVDVYGAKAESLLANIPRGSLVQVQDLFAELPTRGLEIDLPAGGAIALWPQTRMREDGPLVVAYLATVKR